MEDIFCMRSCSSTGEYMIEGHGVVGSNPTSGIACVVQRQNLRLQIARLLVRVQSQAFFLRLIQVKISA